MEIIDSQGGGYSDVLGLLASLPALKGLDDADLAGLAANFTTISIAAGESPFPAGGQAQTLYVLVSGLLEVSGPAGAENVVAHMIPGDVFAEAAYHYSRPRFTTIRAAEASQLIRIPLAVGESLLENRPSVRAAIAAEVARNLLRMHLASAEMFSRLDNALFCYVVAHSEFMTVKRGEIVMRAGEKADCIYIVACGSVEVFQEQKDGSAKPVELLRDGACIGEMALLLNETRSASIRAWRDSLLVRISGECIEHIFRTSAGVTFRLARLLGERLKRTTASGACAVPVKTVSLVSWVDEQKFSTFCEQLQAAIERAGKSVMFMTTAEMHETAGLAPAAPDNFYARLADREAACDYVLCRCEREAPDWTRYCNEQADLALFVCLPDGKGPSEEEIRQVKHCRDRGARAELVLLQNRDATPRGTARWADAAPFGAHHHLAIDDGRHYERLARRVSGESWGLVLSGGGARGLAHIGVIQALLENNIPIDWIGGTSMGAIVAAQYAMGMSPEEMLSASRKAYAGDTADRDYTFPFVSLRTGRSTVRRLQELCGDRQIEDLLVNYFCVTCNLTRAKAVVHDRGPLWMWVRVSCAIPGLLPPFPYKGDLLVDGGFLQNLPVETMKQKCGGRVIASDVSVEADLMVSEELEFEPSWSGLSHLARKLRKQPVLPDIFRIMMRTAELSIVRDAQMARDPTDLYLHPPLHDFGIADFKEIDKIVEIGKTFARQRLLEWKISQ